VVHLLECRRQNYVRMEKKRRWEQSDRTGVRLDLFYRHKIPGTLRITSAYISGVVVVVVVQKLHSTRFGPGRLKSAFTCQLWAPWAGPAGAVIFFIAIS
jgi:hypothetical protein